MKAEMFSALFAVISQVLQECLVLNIYSVSISSKNATEPTKLRENERIWDKGSFLSMQYKGSKD
jgi:hypothetical protein